MRPVLLDASVIVAALDRREARHEACRDALQSLPRPFLSCEPVIAECAFLLARSPVALDALLENVARGAFSLPFQLNRSIAGVRTILHAFRDLPASLADACLVQMADEFDTGEILTLDEHFRIYRWRGRRPFHVWP